MFNTRTKRNSSHKEDSRQRKPFQSLTNMVLRSRKIITKVHNQTPKSVRKTQKNKKDTPRDDYEADILHYLREKEKRQKMAANFIEESSVSANNRQRLVDWMVRVSLVMDQETLELAVAIVDHSLSVVHSVQQELQVFGCVALLLAAKYNEVDFAPEELLELCPNLNSNNIFAMETRILSHLGFSLGLVLPCHFLKGLPLSNAMTELTVFFSNVAIYSALPLTSSQKTSTALHLSSLLLDQRVEHEKPTKNVLKLVAAVLDVHRSEKSLAVRDIYQEKTGGLTEAMVDKLEKILG